ncbi:MAG: MerR family transcriptional regulator [Propionicimonas sp.]
MLTIGELAGYTGVPPRTVRFYHSIGLLPEPARDPSGYRRYSAADAIALLRVRALAEAGVPLAKVPAVLTMEPEGLAEAIAQIDHQLADRISTLQEARGRLQRLAVPGQHLPPGVSDYLELLKQIGLSQAWIAMERDLWILAFATHTETAALLLADQHQAKTRPEVQEIYRAYDQARDLDPDDSRLRDLADRILRTARARYTDEPPPGPPPESPIPQLIQDLVNSTSPAWKRLDRYVRTGLAGR